MDERLVKVFIQKDSDKIYEKMNSKYSFNVFAGLFGILYYIYRKMYLISILLLFIQTMILPELVMLFFVKDLNSLIYMDTIHQSVVSIIVFWSRILN